MDMIELISDPNSWAALLTLSVLEIVLGIDNLVFISLLTARLPAKRARRVRAIGLSLAFLFRVLLLAGLTWLMGLTETLFAVRGNNISWRDIILIGGGLFLIVKATLEIHHDVEGWEEERSPPKATFALIIPQLVAIDLIFSLDSIITAIGMVDNLPIMVAAIVIAMLVMYAAANPVGNFIAEHPTTKMLALAFLLLIGVALIADGFKFHIPRGYIYFAMAFASMVEVFNVRAQRNRRRRRPPGAAAP
jgi:predicted tellurium resistance membrane protein TerC